MGHQISGFVGQNTLLEGFSRSNQLHLPIPIGDELSFLPLSEDHLDKLFPEQGDFDPTMTYLSESLKEAISELSHSSQIAYIETEYFGGLGAQGATVFKDGKCIYGPMAAPDGPISEALRLLGVRKSSADTDEFDTVGLGRYRDNEDWIAAPRSAA